MFILIKLLSPALGKLDEPGNSRSLWGDELGFVAVCSRSEYRVVFIWLRVQLGGEGGGREKFQLSRLSAALLFCC